MIHFTPAQKSHLEFVYSCINTLEETVFDRDGFNAMYDVVLNTKDCFLFVVEHNNEEIGYMSIYVQPLLHHNGKVAEIQELIILPEYRGNGTGRLALEFAKKFATEKNCVLIELASNIRREQAHKFYLSNGFTQSHYKFTCSLI